jgi:hypothetical protein
MGKIKINGNDKELTNLAQDQVSEQVANSELQSNEFKVDANLLENPEAPKPRVIQNLS